MYNRGPKLVVFLPRNPVRHERAKVPQNRRPHPYAVLAVRRGDNAHLRRNLAGRERHDLVFEPLLDTGEHRRATGQHDVGVHGATRVDVRAHDAVEGGLVHAVHLAAADGGVEEKLRAAERRLADRQLGAVREDNLLVKRLRVLVELRHVRVEVRRHAAVLLLDVLGHLAVARRREGPVGLVVEQLHHPLREVASGEIEAAHRRGDAVPLEHRHRVRHTVAAVNHEAVGATCGIERHDGLDLDIHGGHAERLEHDLEHLLAVRFGVKRGLREEHGVVGGVDAQLAREAVLPDGGHVIPVNDDAVLDGVADDVAATRLDGPIPVQVGAARSAVGDGRGENGLGRLVTGKPRLEHTAAVVQNDGRVVFPGVGHVCSCFCM
eukprot:PhM_4_TR10001/c0_g1_i1/m.90410